MPITKLEAEKRQTDGFYMLLLGYARSSFPGFENFLIFVIDLDGDDLQLISKQ